MDLLKQFLRFAGTGGVGTLAHYLILAALVNGLEAAPGVGAAAGAGVGACINYLLSRRFVFASRRPHRETLPRFAAVACVGISFNGALVEWLTRVALPCLVAQLVATGLVLAANFLLNRKWTFRGEGHARRTVGSAENR